MIIAEYIWLDAKNEFRSKIKCIENTEYPPLWNYDGSSTGQAELSDSEITLKPVKVFKNPLLSTNKVDAILVVCSTYNNKGEPLSNNYRNEAQKVFDQKPEEEPWFGLEQEYFMLRPDNNIPGFDLNYSRGKYYCSSLEQNKICVEIAEKHLQILLESEIKCSGINAEVAPGQFEFQIGPCVGIEAGDHMLAARYLLEKIAKKYDIKISYNPKLHPQLSGSGCHTNFSTKAMRGVNGLDHIHNAINNLSKTHMTDIMSYGKGNELRLTGKCETANINTFTHGVGSRNTSIRIGFETFKEKSGYFEDRRPAANCDPYLATMTIFKSSLN